MEDDLQFLTLELTRPRQDQDKAGQDLRLMEDGILNPLITFGQRLNTECSCLKLK